MRTSLETATPSANDDAQGSAHVYTVPPGRPFLHALAAAILRGDLPIPGGTTPQPFDLPNITLLLPTRRAARAMQDAFLTASGGRALMLPRIRPISEAEEELTLLSSFAGSDTFGMKNVELPAAISEIERRLVLTELVLKWSQVMRQVEDAASVLGPHAVAAGANTPAQSAHLAAELSRLMDMVETENVALDGLDKLVPEEFSEHWQDTIDFLKIVTTAWPAYLVERGLLSPSSRRNKAIVAEAQHLAANPPKGSVIVAGVTGSIPATVELMRQVAKLPLGAIVLPGLDPHLDDESWQAIAPQNPEHPKHPEHPQFGLKNLLDGLGLSRKDVQPLPGPETTPAQTTRAEIVAEAMRPSGTTGRWHAYAASANRNAAREALDGVSLIAAPSAQDEAEAIALVLREVAETPGRTAALISPDRLLARRVAVRLEAWGIRVDDSAGRPFAKTAPGTFLDLVISAIAKDFAPTAAMALLKHPLTRLGLNAFDVRRASRALEIAAFRNIYLGEGLEGVAAALTRAEEETASGERRHAAVRRLWSDDWKGAHELVNRLREAFAPLLAVFANPNVQPLQAIGAAHIATAEAIARLPEPPEGENASPLWQSEAGETASTFFTGLLAPNLPAPHVKAADYADLYRSLIVGENVRPNIPVHPRLSIWGPFEARLQQTDVMILGSLNDGTWPQAADPGPWLNRPMRAALGLPSPEEKIGYAAHDFTSLLGAQRVYLTRAEKIDGVPTVPSRWLMRLQALLAGLELSDVLKPEAPWLGWARARDHVGARIRIGAPEPRPSIALRPRKMSVTRVETWIANPYAIFAQEILKLQKLPELGAAPDAALRGSIVHEIMSRFAQAFTETLPKDPEQALLGIANEVLTQYAGHPRVAGFWLPRFERFAHWFAQTEPARRDVTLRVAAEIAGTLPIVAPAGLFTLTARADRIDICASGLIITDYKTGQLPSGSDVKQGRAPQLLLEAAIAAGETGFTGIARKAVTGLRYIRASGGEPPGEERLVQVDSIAGLADAAVRSLSRLVASFDTEETPYKALRRARFSYDYDDYAHLARVREWAALSEDEGAGS